MFAEASIRSAIIERAAIGERAAMTDAALEPKLWTALREGSMRTELRFNFAEIGSFSNADMERAMAGHGCLARSSCDFILTEFGEFSTSQ